MKERIKPILVRPSMTIREVMKAIQEGPHCQVPAPAGIALVVDEKEKLIGIATDGDIRRALLRGASLDESIERAMNVNPVTFPKNLSPDEIMEKVLEVVKQRNISDQKLNFILTVDDEGKTDDVLTFFELWKKTEIKTRTVAMVGLGYVGLTLALTFAELAFRVIGIDTDPLVVEKLKAGQPHFHEKGVEKLLSLHLNKNFFVHDHFVPGESDVYIVCVGTPVDEQKKIDLEPLKNALFSVAKVLKVGDLVVLRSTVGVGTCRNHVIPVLESTTNLKAGEDFYLAFAPERTVEGKALEELRTLPQIIGGYNKVSVDLTTRLFKFITPSIITVSNLEIAEMIKLINNVYRDLTISYANEIAQLCDRLNLDTYEVIKAANIGYERSAIPKPGPGVGGYCLPKDPFIFFESARQVNYEVKLPLLARQINEKMPDFICDKVFQFCQDQRKNPADVKIFALGVAFKGEPETSDMRESPSLSVIQKLKERFNNVVVYDPVVREEELKKQQLVLVSLEEGFTGADCVLILNNHLSYSDLDFYQLLGKTKKPSFFFDCWHMSNPETVKQVKGVIYKYL